LTAADCEGVQAVYDRAAIVALPPEMRQKYAAHLKAILPKGSRYLMVAMEYDQTKMPGPPFAVFEAEVRDLFADFESVELVETIEFERKGVPALEKVYVLKS
jgi:thiopurine S-methyltransferase